MPLKRMKFPHELLMLLMIFSALFFIVTGCKRSEKITKPKRGLLYRIPVEEQAEKEFMTQQKLPELPEKNPAERIVYNSLPEMMLALNSGKIDYFRTTGAVAAWLLFHDPSLNLYEMKGRTKYYRMAVLTEKRELCDQLNEAITSLKKSGTLKDLQTIHIDGAMNGGIPQQITLPSFPNAPLIQVAITGDLPPMDYVSDQGKPAGYDMALLAEIAKYLKINIQTVPMNAGARMTALASGKVDVLFWTEMDLENYQNGSEILLTKSYRSDTVTFIARDFPLEQIKILDRVPQDQDPPLPQQENNLSQPPNNLPQQENNLSQQEINLPQPQNNLPQPQN